MKQKGFTLIELMIAVAIVGIIAAIGFSTTKSGATKSRRANAKAVLVKVQSKQEQYFIANKAYTDDLVKLKYASSPFYIDGKGESVAQADSYYQISLESGLSPGGYSVVATAQNTQAADDAKCAVLKVNQSGTKSPSPDPNRCW